METVWDFLKTISKPSLACSFATECDLKIPSIETARNGSRRKEDKIFYRRPCFHEMLNALLYKRSQTHRTNTPSGRLTRASPSTSVENLFLVHTQSAYKGRASLAQLVHRTLEMCVDVERRNSGASGNPLFRLYDRHTSTSFSLTFRRRTLKKPIWIKTRFSLQSRELLGSFSKISLVEFVSFGNLFASRVYRVAKMDL